MAQMRQDHYDYDISFPVSTAQAVQKRDNGDECMTLEALGLLINLCSYTGTWELHKTELYKRFGKNGRTSVKSAWDNLMDLGYIIEYKYRVGKTWEHVYHYRRKPYTSEEKAQILDNARKEFGQIWDVDFVQPKMGSPKSTYNKRSLLNKKPLLNNNKDIHNNIDDDKRTIPSESSPLHNDENINLIINLLRDATKDDLNDRSFKSVVRKVVDKYNQGKVGSFRDYLATSLANKIEALELRRIKEQARSALDESKARRADQMYKEYMKRISEVDSNPEKFNQIKMYNWLEDD
jgi:hypothetical protein